MEEDQKVNHAESELLFGKLTDTPTIQKVLVRDINQQKLKISVNSLEITIKQLIKFYKINSSCSHQIKGEPNFRIAQGNQQGKLALQNELLSSFGFSWRQICFKIEDSAQEANKSKIDKQQKQNEIHKSSLLKIQINLIIQNCIDKFPININLSERVIDLKRKAIQKVPLLKQKTTDMIKMIYKGTPMLNQNEMLYNHKLQKNAIIFVKTHKKVGCFNKNSLVMMANKTTKPISNIQFNDQILSLNIKTGQYQTDIVTYVQKCVLQQQITIVLQNGAIINTTPNHSFLCSDGQYRCYTSQQLNSNTRSLKQGDTLKTLNSIDLKITQIYGGRVEIQNNQFYHLSIQKNHNFIIDNLITHNMTINLKFPKKQIIPIDASPSQTIKQIKQKIEDLSHTQLHCQKLLFAGKELSNYNTLNQQNIFKQSTLHVIYKKPQLFNLVQQHTLILKANGQKVPVSNLIVGDQIATMNTQNGKLAKGDIIQKIQIKQLQQYFTMGLNQRDNLIQIAADSYVELYTGQAISVREICYEQSQTATLRKFNDQKIQVKGMAHYSKQIFKKKFYQLSLIHSKNFIANDIVIHNLVINIVLIKKQKRTDRFCFGASPSDTISLIKQKIQIVTDIPSTMITLSFSNHQDLQDNKTIQQYKIYTQHVIFAFTTEPSSKFGLCYTENQQPPQIHQQKTLEIQISPTQKEIINYHQHQHSTVEEIINQILPNYHSSYFFIFSDLILYPKDQLLKIQSTGQAFSSFSENTILLIKNQKLNFIKQMDIKKQEVGNFSSIQINSHSNLPTINKLSSISVGISTLNNWLHSKQIQIASIRIQNDPEIKCQEYKQWNFYISFLQYTSRRYTHKINSFITNLQRYKIQNQHDDIKRTLNIIKDLYINMQLLNNYYQKCYLGVKNFKFSHYFKKNNTFYLHSFTLAFKESQKIISELNGHRGTLFHISSINGKEIQKFSLYPNEKEILFAPFTYFLVLQIIQKDNYDQVYLVELSAPITFQKNIILWVDDWPKNNIKQISSILQQLDIQILQLTSTLQAQMWIKEFGWLVTWKGLQFKIISDMARYQGIERQGFKRQQNKTAGIDLLAVLYNKHKFNVQTLIYCKNKAWAQQAVKEARIQSNKFRISTFISQLKKFCNIQNKK